MTGQQLRNSILQEAIQGKLVPQKSEDGNAIDLIKKIREEKKKLEEKVKGKKKSEESIIFRKDGSFFEQIGEKEKCIDEEISFSIPKSWEWVRLNIISKQIHYGYTASATNIGNAKLTRITDIQNNKIDWSTVPYCSISLSDLEKYKLKNRDILIARTGGTIGKTYIVKDLKENAVFASYLIRIIPIELVNEEYLKLFMETPLYWKQLKNFSMGTGQPNVNGQSLSNLLLPLPPLAEQERIITKIEKLLPLIEEYGSTQQNLSLLKSSFPKQLRNSILQEAIQGKLVPQRSEDGSAADLLKKIREEKKKKVKEQVRGKKKVEESVIFRKDGTFFERIGKEEKCIDEEIPFSIPESWELVRLGNIVCLEDGIKTNNKSYRIMDAKFLRKKSEGVIANEGRFVERDSYLILVDGENSGEVFSAPIDGYLGSTFKKLVISKEMFDFYVLRFINLNKTKLKNSKTGEAIPHLNKELFFNLLLPLPPLAEQKRIVAKIEELLPLVDSLLP